MIRDEATQRQVDAANPQVSTWLSANAGSGKTRVLTDRVARLLLEDVSPQNILCLTYTKAAATEMQNRLFARLGAWAMMPDDALQAELAALGAKRIGDADHLRHARRLFAMAIETPGGLKIQTIHSFCAAILRRFPLEARVSPQFREMEDREAALLRADVMDQLVTGPDAAVVQDMLAHFGGGDLDAFTAEIAQRRDAFAGGFDDDALAKTLGITADPTDDAAIDIAFLGGEVQLAHDIAQAFSSTSKMYIDFAARLNTLNLANPTLDDVKALFPLFLYADDGTSKSANFPQSRHSKAVAAIAPLANSLHAWMDRTAAAREHLLAVAAYDRTRALHAFARRFIPAYEARKLAMGALDFDDLIRKAKALLTDPSVAQWVLFRLDGGIDHVLVDEAQDTSPTQWAVIEQLTQEFTSGAGARANRDRTIFVVGDKKQSIYSFQGADPAAFDRMKAHFGAAQTAIGKRLQQTTLDYSFRSSQAILSVVDATFTGDRAAGMDSDVGHRAFRADMPGRVDLWPVIDSAEKEEDRPWYSPVDAPSALNHTVLMAQRVAAQIKHMTDHDTLPVRNAAGGYDRRKVTEGDILILVQRRSDLFTEIIRACKNVKLKVAGADRLRVGAELAVKDLAALLAFLALPEDDLSLAAALRSPLFGWSEQDLFTLAHHRQDGSYLWQALRAADHPATLSIINDLRSQSDFLRPYDLIARILTRHDGRRRLLARLGPEAEDGIDALLTQALAYESTAVPSLTGFLSWMQTDDLEVKRQMESAGDRIRVMTVHGAKGLEAPIVILPDCAKRQVRVRQELLPTPDTVIWKTPAAASAPAVSNTRDAVIEKERRERLRLLYVAMTRAENWLIVGAAGDIGDDGESWYSAVADAMQDRGAMPVEHGPLQVDRVAAFTWNAGAMITPSADYRPLPAPPSFHSLPTRARKTTLSPSDLSGAKVMPGDPGGDDAETAKTRGTLIHLLLEHLPTAPAKTRADVGTQLVGANHADLVRQVTELLDNPDLSHIWSPHALTEVAVTADIPTLGRIHGAIDRLLVTGTHVTAVDYKSNRLVPDRAKDVPLGLQRQMAVYHAALSQVYPDRTITAAILWTETGTLMDLPASLLHDSLKDIATS
ncbi:MAG: double-strand break repair helicase AddA [Pseudomonadota bacterium]